MVVLPALVGAAVVAFTVIERRPDHLCRQWEREARMAEGDRLGEVIGRLDAYGSYGLPSLVRLLDCDRNATAGAARDVLKARLRRAGNASSAATIADELHKLADGRSQPVTQAAADVALELLEAAGRMSLAEPGNDTLRDRLVSACDAVLEHVPPVESQKSMSIVRTQSPSLQVSKSEPETERPETTTHLPPPAPLPVAIPAPPAPIAVPVVAEVEPSPRTAANTAAKINPVREPTTDEAVRPAAAVSIPRIAPAWKAVEPPTGDAWSLFAALDEPNAESAADELRRRGFTTAEIELGRHLADSDVAERLRYAKLLPTMRGIDAKPWLLRLSRDAHDEVRRTVAAIMATTGDPELLARVRTMSLDDPSEEVRNTASRVVTRR